MDCPNCGAQNSDRADFCSLCLHPFKETPKEEKQSKLGLIEEETEEIGSQYKKYTKKDIAKFVVAVLVASTFVWFAYNQIISIVQRNTNKKIIELANSMKFKTSGGSMQMAVRKVPKGFPKDIPIYKGAVVVTGFTIESDNKQDSDYSVTWEANDNYENVINFYNEALTENGFQIINEPKDGYAFIKEFKNDNGSTFKKEGGTVTVRERNGKCSFTIAVIVQSL